MFKPKQYSMVSLQVEFITYDSLCRWSNRQNLYATESLFSSIFLPNFLAWFFQFSCCNLNQISRWNFHHFPHTVVFQQQNEIPFNVQQDSCSNQAIIFVREGWFHMLYPRYSVPLTPLPIQPLGCDKPLPLPFLSSPKDLMDNGRPPTYFNLNFL